MSDVLSDQGYKLLDICDCVVADEGAECYAQETSAGTVIPCKTRVRACQREKPVDMADPSSTI